MALGSSKTVRQYVTHDKFMKKSFLAAFPSEFPSELGESDSAEALLLQLAVAALVAQGRQGAQRGPGQVHSCPCASAEPQPWCSW